MYFAAIVIENIPNDGETFKQRYRQVFEFCEMYDLFMILFVKAGFTEAEAALLRESNYRMFNVISYDVIGGEVLSAYNFDVVIDTTDKYAYEQCLTRLMERGEKRTAAGVANKGG